MKVAIYLRTSTVDQDPEKQKQECVTLAESRGYEIEGIYHEQLSAYKKNLNRPVYEEIKDKAHKGEIQAVVVWALDRWVRDRDTLIDDITTLTSYGCKIHSVKDAWIEDINIEGAMGRTIRDFLIGLLGTLAELESLRRSDRTKMAYESGRYKSWGRKSLPEKTRQEILRLHSEGMTTRKISQSVYYYDKNNHKKNVALGTVHKIIKEFKGENNKQ